MYLTPLKFQVRGREFPHNLTRQAFIVRAGEIPLKKTMCCDRVEAEA